MKKNRFVKTLLVLTMTVAMAIAFAGCGGSSGSENTLEDFFAQNPDKVAEIEAESSEASGGVGELELTAEGNTAIYTFTMNETYDSATLDTMKKYMEQNADELLPEEQMQQFITQIEEGFDADDVTLRIVYLNGDGQEIFSKEFK